MRKLFKFSMFSAVVVAMQSSGAFAQDAGCVLGRSDYDSMKWLNVPLDVVYADLPCPGREYVVDAGVTPEGGNWMMISDEVRRGAEWLYRDDNGVGTLRVRVNEDGLVEGFGYETKPFDSAANPIVGLSGLFPYE